MSNTIANHSDLLKLDLQFFSEEFETVITPDPVEPIDPADLAPVDDPGEPAQPEDEFDVIKYNKEEIKIPVSERQNYLQKGYNYDKVKQRADELERSSTYLERVAKYSGYQTVDEFINAVEQAEEQQRIQQEAQRLGLNEDAYRQHFEPVSNELSQVKSQLEEMQRERALQQIDREVNDLRAKYEDFGQYEDQVFQLSIERGYTLEDAYRITTYEDRIQNVAKQKEQEVLANITGRDQRQVLSSNDQPSNTVFDPAAMSLEDIEKLSERVKRGERITF